MTELAKQDPLQSLKIKLLMTNKMLFGEYADLHLFLKINNFDI